MRSHHFLRALALAGAFLCGHALAADAAKALPPSADFFTNPEFSDAVLSPSGKYLAVRLATKGKHDVLGVVDLATDGIKVVGNFNDADVGQYRWVNDNRLVFTAADRDLGEADMRYAPGLYAINRDGTGFRQLAMRSWQPFLTSGASTAARDLLPWHTYLMGQRGAQDSDFIYVLDRNYSNTGEFLSSSVLRLNTVTGRTSGNVPRPGDSVAWMLDNEGEPRLTTTREKGGSNNIYYRDPATKDWRKLTDFERYTGRGGGFRPLAFGNDGTLYVIHTTPGQDTTSVYSYDIASGKLSDKALVNLEGYDFNGQLIMDKDKLLGVRHLTDAWGTTWLDPAMQAMQAKVDQLLPNTANLLTLPSRAETPWVMVSAYADIWPRRLMLYNSETGKLRMISATFPNIDPNQMARKELVHYKARDGLSIPAWLTLPKGAGKNLPMVVLVHGGPWARGGSWEWVPAVQFLASRGYAVLEPEYRGSTGYGSKLFRAGWKQWGMKMQDDIADGTRWAIAQGYADAQRICIGGPNYGGYATLMGLIKDPDLYKCGVEWLGITDINLLYDGSWNYRSDMSDDYKRYGMPALIGDQEKDAEQFKATSPLLRAAEIKQPLLMAYGGADTRVTPAHSIKFYKAIKATNPNVELIEYEEEGHGWKLPKNRVDFWDRVDKFLDKNIGAH
ncbi:prolyl oligopeptidase family serine peptidase [Pseudoduganella sp. FT25W]|jgi:dipeptidyl aminopeptidase/acylaminoacyl peptidase|uniref:Prolyl oligopeptidase family serine peptidase n=1 Tax=Duganella alba TaxID=2666081 RepID=A0A6L5QFS9_9BURK|nr:prolyl oligopeptidase family serine peptidase [Duganella alba]MRX08529.1 prolyl oligopeptidase family serine peptidase [Duganella alba]MRX16997.1 prolyl oligopeptidase family serine peptidase [Duganella alba]